MARLEKEARNASDQAQQRQSRDQLLGATLSGDDNQCKFGRILEIGTLIDF